MAKKVLGIDIGNAGIWAVQLESRLSGQRIAGHRYVPFPESNPPPAAVTSALKTAVGNFSIKGARCAASVPARHVFFRNLLLPAFEPRKIRPILPFELEPLLPFPPEDLVTDFSVFRDTQRPDQTDVVTATLRKTDLSHWLDLFASAGLEPETLTFKGYPLALLLAKQNQTSRSWIFVDVDRSTATCFAFQDAQLCFIRCVSMASGETLPEESLVQAIRQTVFAVGASLARDYHPEIIRVHDSTQEPDPQELDSLGKHLGTPVAFADPFGASNARASLLPDLSEVPSAGHCALSLSLLKSRRFHGMQFLQGTFSPKTHLGEFKPDLVKTGAVLAAALILAVGYLALDFHLLQRKASRLSAHTIQAFQSAFPKEKVIVDPVAQMKAKIEDLKKRSLPSEAKGPRIRRVDLLKEISQQIPAQLDLEVSRLTAGDEDLVLTGSTDTFNTVNDMKSRLAGSRLFREVTITSASQNRTGNRVDFVLMLRF